MSEFFRTKRYGLDDLAGWCITSFILAAALKTFNFAPKWMLNNVEMGLSYLTTFVGLSLYSYISDILKSHAHKDH